MAIEIERKFLVVGDDWREGAQGVHLRQGYLSTVPERTVRARVAGDRGFLTIKGKARGAARAEYEYPIPVTDAHELLDHLCERPLIEKIRYRVDHGGHTWEIDVFAGTNEGLVLAEVELRSEDEAVDLPPWVGVEVTHDSRYTNASLVRMPHGTW